MVKWIVRSLAIVGYALIVLKICCPEAHAHDVPASNVLLDIGSDSVAAEMQLPLYELREAIGLPVAASAQQLASQYAARVDAYIEKHVDVTAPDGRHYAKAVALLEASHIRGSDWIIARVDFDAPPGVATGVFTLHDDVIVADIVTHNILVSVRRDFRNAIFSGNVSAGDGSGDSDAGGRALVIGLMHYQQRQLTVDGSDGSWMRGFGKVFLLGMRHIAEGTDHMLFLLVLLLAAPLRARGGHWDHAVSMRTSARNVLKTVSGFTLGHSLTLVLGAIGVFRFPARPIEVLIAVSILVSAVHAIRPLFAAREHYVAALFGLVHGMAFAGSLTGFDYDSLALALAVLGFNLGIETMQLIVVALVLPSLLLMRVSPLYRYVRVGTAAITATLAVGWVLQRALGVSNPLDRIASGLTLHAVAVMVALAAVAVLARAGELARYVAARFATPRQSRINSIDRYHR